MEIAKVPKEKLNNFLIEQRYPQFLQSWEWGVFNEESGKKVFRIGVEDKGELLAAATYIKNGLRQGKSYFYCPRGPVFKNAKKAAVDILFKAIEEDAKKENAIFLRFESEFIMEELARPISLTLDVQPKQTIVIGLNQSLEDILSDMRQKTRYNIRLAGRKGVSVRVSRAVKDDFKEFWSIMEQTQKRNSFRLHPRRHYERMLSIFSGQGNYISFDPLEASGSPDKKELNIKLILAEYKNKVIAGAITAFFGDTATYIHGASSGRNRNLMAPYLLHWRIIELAKKLGCRYYDLNGIDREKWPGVTKFKTGFSRSAAIPGNKDSRIMIFPGAYDLVFDSKWYGVYKIIRKIRRIF